MALYCVTMQTFCDYKYTLVVHDDPCIIQSLTYYTCTYNSKVHGSIALKLHSCAIAIEEHMYFQIKVNKYRVSKK